jgi:hypothetical protein
MQRFYLKELGFHNCQINFNDGMNIILGSSNSGKTTLFDLIQYVMGLKRTWSNNHLINYEDFYVECVFGDQRVRFSRPIKSNLIYITGDITFEAKVGTTQIHELYNLLLSPSFEFGQDETAGYQILKSSFLPELNISYGYPNIGTIKKILGLNIAYLDESKKQIEHFKEQSKLENNSFTLLQRYITNVSDNFKKDKSFDEIVSQKIFKILEHEYQMLYIPTTDNLSFLHQSIEAYEVLKTSIEQMFKDKVSILEKTFYNYKRALDIYNNDDLLNLLNTKKLSSSSAGEMLLLNFLISLSLMSNHDEELLLNSSHFIAVDSTFEIVHQISALRNIIARECSKGGLQYIEFTHKLTDDIPSDWVIYDLDRIGGLKWVK